MTQVNVQNMVEVSDKVRNIIDYCASKAKNGMFYEATLLNSIAWNAVHKMYSNQWNGVYSYTVFTDEEKDLCNALFKEISPFLLVRTNKRGRKEYIFNRNKLFIQQNEKPEEDDEDSNVPVICTEGVEIPL